MFHYIKWRPTSPPPPKGKENSAKLPSYIPPLKVSIRATGQRRNQQIFFFGLRSHYRRGIFQGFQTSLDQEGLLFWSQTSPRDDRPRCQTSPHKFLPRLDKESQKQEYCPRLIFVAGLGKK